MDDEKLADNVSGCLVRILIFCMMVGTLGLVKLIYDEQIRQKALLENAPYPKQLMNFRGTSGRLEYILTVFCLFVVSYLFLLPFSGTTNDNYLILVVFGVLGIIALIMLLAVVTRRCRDLSISPYWFLLIYILSMLLTIIPCVGVVLPAMISIALLFLPGGRDYKRFSLV